METKELLTYLKDDYQRVFDGEPWLGRSLKQALKGVNAERAFYRPLKNGHTIAELLTHIISWREVLVNKLEHNSKPKPAQQRTFEPEHFGENEKEIWSNLLLKLDEQQAQLIFLLEEAKDKKRLPMRVIHGVIQHDIYHMGQIVLLKKADF